MGNVAFEIGHGSSSDDAGDRLLSQNDDGGVITWSWRGDQILDHRTITRVGAALAPATDVPEWSCLDADEPDAPPVPRPTDSATAAN